MEELSDKNVKFTIFVPSDKALKKTRIQRLLKSKGMLLNFPPLLLDLDVDEILRFHIVKGIHTKATLTRRKSITHTLPLRTLLAGKKLVADLSNGTALFLFMRRLTSHFSSFLVF